MVVSDRPTGRGTPGGPRRTQILAQVKRTRHRVANHFAAEPVAQRVAVTLGDGAHQRDGVAADRSRDVSCEEIALVDAVQSISALLEMNGMERPARGVLDLDLPAA